MPATTPAFGVPKVAVVVARLIVDGEDRGSRSFIVPICTATAMHPGVTSIRLPRRSGTSPLDFSLTQFDHVRLPPSALLGSSLDVPKEPRSAWWDEVWRIPYGSMVVTAPCLTGLKHVAYIGAQYSLHRHVTGQRPAPVPIITFPTQQWAILHAVAAATVLDVWYREVIKLMTDGNVENRVKHGMAVVVKTTVCRQAVGCAQRVGERCGAQGTFVNNFMAQFEVRCLLT
jgi:acyl-CoA oxidase